MNSGYLLDWTFLQSQTSCIIDRYYQFDGPDNLASIFHEGDSIDVSIKWLM